MDSMIGKSIRRKEDFRLLTGRGRFSDDVDVHGQAYAAFVRSPHAHARIRGVEAAAAITAVAEVGRIDWERLAARTQVVGYPILPLVEQLSGWAEDGLGQWCHWGATTQDIMDTADVLQIRDALDLIAADLDAVLREQARAQRRLIVHGRPHRIQHR